MIKSFFATQAASAAASLVAIILLSALSQRLPVATDFLGMIYFTAPISLVIFIAVYYPFIHPIFISKQRSLVGSVIFIGLCGGIGWSIFSTLLVASQGEGDLIQYLVKAVWFAFMMGFVYGGMWGVALFYFCQTKNKKGSAQTGSLPQDKHR